MKKEIRNFSIIAHIDHGKSTLSDRLLELTKTLSQRELQEQSLDMMDLERERGITIKMQPVTMQYLHNGLEYTLNLIDTPGHIDFSYEVSRSLQAVEGAILLVDATQGVQAQTGTTLSMAQKQGLVIVPVLSKIDSPLARVDDIKLELAEFLGIDDLDSILEVSGKTGEGVERLLQEIITRVPAPEKSLKSNGTQALVFDFSYSAHRGVIVYCRVMSGSIKTGDRLKFVQGKKECSALEVGVFRPHPVATQELVAGEIGYIVTGIKESGFASVGDTLTLAKSQTQPLPGYQKPAPVIWASIYPESQDDFPLLATALGKLQFSDASFTYEEESSGVLGRGFRVGCLGMLHLEILSERLRREFDLDLVLTSPSVTYRVILSSEEEVTTYNPAMFPDHGEAKEVYEPYCEITVMFPERYLNELVKLLQRAEAQTGGVENFGDGRIRLVAQMPLRELMRGFFDDLKSVTSGYGSLSYKVIDERLSDVVRLDILVAEERVPAFCQVVPRKKAQSIAEQQVEKLQKLLPRQMFVVKIQAKFLGRIIASRSLKALRKDVTGHLYGGDITRKMKLREKQKQGKKRMMQRGKVAIPQDVFLKMIKNEN